MTSSQLKICLQGTNVESVQQGYIYIVFSHFVFKSRISSDGYSPCVCSSANCSQNVLEVDGGGGGGGHWEKGMIIFSAEDTVLYPPSPITGHCFVPPPPPPSPEKNSLEKNLKRVVVYFEGFTCTEAQTKRACKSVLFKKYGLLWW